MYHSKATQRYSHSPQGHEHVRLLTTVQRLLSAALLLPRSMHNSTKVKRFRCCKLRMWVRPWLVNTRAAAAAAAWHWSQMRVVAETQRRVAQTCVRTCTYSAFGFVVFHFASETIVTMRVNPKKFHSASYSEITATCGKRNPTQPPSGVVVACKYSCCWS